MFKKLRNFFTPPQLKVEEVKMNNWSGYQSDKAYEENAQNLAVADHELQKQALQHTLDLMHRTMLIALLTLLVAVATIAWAVLSKPTVTVKVDEQKVQNSSTRR